MSLINKSLYKLPVNIHAFSSFHLTKNIFTKRNFSLTSTNKFLFRNKKDTPATNKFIYETIKFPNSTWKMGEPQKIPSGSTTVYNPNEINELLRILCGLMPRTSNLISTISKEGVTNVAPYALCTCISSDPLIMILTVYKNPDGTLKDTQINIDDTNEFGVNIVSDWLVESSHAAGAQFPHNVSEFEKVGFTKRTASVIKAPLVAQCAVNFECKVTTRTPLINKEGIETGILYQADILKIHINDEVFNNEKGKINYDKYKLAAKLGGFEYSKINNVLSVEPASSS